MLPFFEGTSMKLSSREYGLFGMGVALLLVSLFELVWMLLDPSFLSMNRPLAMLIQIVVLAVALVLIVRFLIKLRA